MQCIFTRWEDRIVENETKIAEKAPLPSIITRGDMRIVVGRMRTRMARCGLGMSSLSGLRGGAGIFFMSSAAVDAGLLGSVGVAINDASGLPHTPVSSVAGLVTPFGSRCFLWGRMTLRQSMRARTLSVVAPSEMAVLVPRTCQDETPEQSPLQLANALALRVADAEKAHFVRAPLEKRRAVQVLLLYDS